MKKIVLSVEGLDNVSRYWPTFGIREIKIEIDLHNMGVKARNKNHSKVVVKQSFDQLIPTHPIRQQLLKPINVD